MITASQLKSHRRAGDDFEETERLKRKFILLRKNRSPLYITGSEFEEILKWKLRGQFGRQRKLRKLNTEEIIKKVSGIALTISHDDKDYETELRTTILCALRGVGVPVASAVLALVYPEDYAVIDFRGWRQFFGGRKTSFTISDYKKYLMEIRRLSAELDWPAQEVDFAVWSYDHDKGTRA